MSLENELKTLIEKLSPDLRAHMRLSLSGVVTKVHEDDYRVDVEIPGDDDEVLSLPFIPVKSPMALDGWGIFALPEVDSEVTVAFWGGDPTNPYVDGSVLLNNRTPVGAKAGMIVITDRVGQCIKLKPHTGEVIINGYNLKVTTTGSEARLVDRSLTEDIGENHNITVGRASNLTIKGKRKETFEGPVEREYKKPVTETIAQRETEIDGGDKLNIGGMQDVTVGSDRKVKVLGADFEAIAKSKQVLVGGNLDIMVANAMDTPMPAAVQIGNPPPMINCRGGLFVPGTSAPMVNGTLLVSAFTAYTNAIDTALAALASSFSGPNPVTGSQIAAALGTFATAVAAAISALITALTGSCSTRQFFAVP